MLAVEHLTALCAVADRLACPHCGAALALRGHHLRCDRGHHYDVGRRGLVSLLAPTRRRHEGDTPAMVAARDAFLGAGEYARITAAIVAAAQEARGARPEAGAARDPFAEPSARPAQAAASDACGEHSVRHAPERCVRDARRSTPVPGCAIDLGAGTGHHLAALLAGLPGWSGIALDASRPALRRALAAHPRIAAIACDVWAPLPLRDGAADLALNVFAPRHGAEIARVLTSEGSLVVVTPTRRHLHQLVTGLGLLEVGAAKQERLHASLAPALTTVRGRRVEFDMVLSPDEVRALVGMGPSAHHIAPAELDDRLAGLPEAVTVTASVIVETFRRA